MNHKLYNIIFLGVFSILSVVCYMLDKDILKLSLIAVVIYALGYVIFMAVKREPFHKIILYPLIGAVAAFGFISTVNAVCSLPEYFGSQIASKKMSNEIVNDVSNFKEVFENDKYFYYIDRDYGNMYEIEKDNFSNISSYTIYGSDSISDMDGLSPFYPLDGFKNFTKTSDYNISFAFASDVEDVALLVRMANDTNVYYTYLIPDDINDIVENNNAFELFEERGFLKIYLSAPTSIVDMNGNDSGDYSDKKTFAIVVNDGSSYIYSEATYVSYDEHIDYTERVNNFFNREILMEIEDTKKQAKNASGDTVDEELSVAESALRSELKSYYVELVDEYDSELGGKIRMYRTYCPDDENDDIDDAVNHISVIEWEYDGQYMLFSTYISMNSTFDFFKN